MGLTRKHSLRDSYADRVRRGKVKAPTLAKSYIRPVAKHKQSDRARYVNKVRPEYIAAHPWCEICPKRGRKDRFRTTDIHHTRGRIGRLLCDTRFFLGGCRPCHDWAHENPREARALGITAPASEWNVYPE